MELLLISVCSIVIWLLYEKFLKGIKDVFILSIPIFLLWIYIFMPVTFYFFFNGFLPGKPDQDLYYEFASNYNINSLTDTVNIAFERNFHNFLYWQIATIAYNLSFFSPVLSLCLINFVAHLFISIFAYYSIYLILGSKRKAKIGMLFFLFSPTFISFGLYIIRDILIVLAFAGMFLSLLFIYKRGFSVKYVFLLIIFSFFAFSLRGQLILVISLLSFQIFLTRFFRDRSFLFYSILQVVFLIQVYIIIKIFNLNFAGSGVLVDFLIHLISWDLLKTILIKFPIYILGIGFLDPQVGKTFSLQVILLTRLLAIDSLVIPFIFVYFYIKKWRKDVFVNLIIFALFLYFALYMYAQNFFEGGYGFHFRAMLPFFYVFYLLVISEFLKKDKVSMVN
ncbi:hypothetical protein HRbin19_00997 [bacterium HR19]|nr:hypothetical protein HRbin19_00997 [bacterium HR19]